MSNIAIKGAATGSGTFTLEAPATSTNRTLTLPDEAGTIITTAGVPSSAMPAGTVLQVVQGFKTDTFSTASATFSDVPDLSVTLTPTSSSSKFLIMVNMTYLATQFVAHLKLMRNATEIGMADTASNRPTFFLSYSNGTNANADGPWVRESMDFLDSPNTTSAVTYKLQAAKRLDAEGCTFYINRTHPDRNTVGYDARGVSSIVVMEVAG